MFKYVVILFRGECMEQYHGPSKTKKHTGKKKKKIYDKKKRFLGRSPTNTRVLTGKGSKEGAGEERKVIRVKGGNYKVRLRKVLYVNVSLKENDKVVSKKVKITGIESTPENRHHARMHIVTKGSIVNTEIGKVRITSRPGQNGVLNGVPA